MNSNEPLIKQNKSNDIWVFIEVWQGKVTDVSLELLSKASELSKVTKGTVTALVLTSENIDVNLLSEYGAQRIHLAKDPSLKNYSTLIYTTICTSAILEYSPSILLIGATQLGRELAPRIAARVATGLTADCTELEIDLKTNLLLQTRPAFGGSMLATIVTEKTTPQIATFRPGVIQKKRQKSVLPATVTRLPIRLGGEFEYDILSAISLKVDEINTDRSIIVGAGRGVRTIEGLNLVREFADKIRASFVTSRSLVDMGIAKPCYQVGQTGRSVSPELYIACGISGAVQHIAGIKNAKRIMAINTDPDAAIFMLADYCVKADLFELLPRLIERFNTK